MKKYCQDCKYLRVVTHSGSWDTNHYCKVSFTLEDEGSCNLERWARPNRMYKKYEYCCKKNSKNDCSDFTSPNILEWLLMPFTRYRTNGSGY